MGDLTLVENCSRLTHSTGRVGKILPTLHIMFDLMTEFYKQLSTAPIKAEAMRRAQIEMINGNVMIEGGVMRGSRGSYTLPESLQEIENQTLTHPYYWAAFTLIGSPW